MANYMAEVARLLGVELEEQFEYESLPGIPFKLTEHGLECLGPAKISRDVMNEALVRMITGCSKIKRKPWKPKYKDGYWTVNANCDVEYVVWYDCMIDVYCYKLGNCYRTNKEAEANRDKWMHFYTSDEVLEV